MKPVRLDPYVRIAVSRVCHQRAKILAARLDLSLADLMLVAVNELNGKVPEKLETIPESPEEEPIADLNARAWMKIAAAERVRALRSVAPLLPARSLLPAAALIPERNWEAEAADLRGPTIVEASPGWDRPGDPPDLTASCPEGCTENSAQY